MKLIVGSKSPARRNIIARMGFADVVFESADIDEKSIRDADPARLVELLACAKADVLLPQLNEGILLTFDQVIVKDGEIREKPDTREQLRYYLETLHESSLLSYVGVCVTDVATKKRVEGVDVVTVSFHPLTPEEIEEVMRDEALLHCAGGFKLEHPLFTQKLKTIDGEHESVEGLPVALVRQLVDSL